MRYIVVLVLLSLLLGGCSASDDAPTAGVPPLAEPGSETRPEDSPPPTTSSSEWADSAGRSPDQAVLALIDTLDSHDWDTAYSLYADPEVDLATAEREWTEADEGYAYFDVQETLVSSEDSAQVRVTYEVTTTPPGGKPYTVTVDEPGEWWSLSRVDGLWKVQWMPRQ